MFLKKPKDSCHISVKLPDQKQDIVIGSGLKDWVMEEISSRGYLGLIIFIDKNFAELYKDWFLQIKNILSPNDIIFIEASETSKSLEFLNSVLEKCFKANVNRKSCIVAIGGGIVGDIAGFFASVYMRGIDFIFIPTTLMAQADTIVYKVAISYKFLKNIVGSFYSPVLTVCDTDFLRTLPKDEIAFGLSEVIKHALIDSPSFLKYLENNLISGLAEWVKYPWKEIVYKSLIIKSNLVAKDPFDEGGYHKGLSYGHTFANAFEGLSEFKFRHGESVSLGMRASALVSRKLKILSENDFERQERILQMVELPLKFPRLINNEMLINLMQKDKICAGDGLTLVILEKIGKFKVHKNIDPEIIESILRDL